MLPKECEKFFDISNMNKSVFIFAFIFLLSLMSVADSYSGASENSSLIVRSPIWVFTEPIPGNFKSNDANKIKVPDLQDKNSHSPVPKYLPTKQAMQELASYLLSGMCYGWKFSYTPYDKTRAVNEFFELAPITKIDLDDKRLVITEPKFKYPFLYCWAEYHMSENQASHLKFWHSVSHKTITGRGSGNRFDELKGVYTAYTEATKNAIREYARKIVKNKPKQITGSVLIKKNPRLFVESGLFNAELNLYIQIDNITPYTIF